MPEIIGRTVTLSTFNTGRKAGRQAASQACRCRSGENRLRCDGRVCWHNVQRTSVPRKKILRRNPPDNIAGQASVGEGSGKTKKAAKENAAEELYLALRPGQYAAYLTRSLANHPIQCASVAASLRNATRQSRREIPSSPRPPSKSRYWKSPAAT
jgi:hypothetical protein